MADVTKDNFTLGEMREARNKAARGEPLTDKEGELADARRKAEGWGAIPIYIVTYESPVPYTVISGHAERCD